jgi:hypothetical protein
MNFDIYDQEIDEVLIEGNPIFLLENLLKDKPKISTVDMLKMIIHAGRNWQKFQSFGITLCISFDEDKVLTTGENFAEYDFGSDLKEILVTSNIKSAEYTVCSKGFIINKNLRNAKVNFKMECAKSHLNKKITIILGVNGLDIIVNGVPFDTKNHLDSYQDLIKWTKLIGIDSYRQLLQGFFESHVQYDKYKRYFLYKDTSPNEWHESIKKHSKLLVVKPEKIFQMELERFLKDNCIDTVLNEVRNDYEERYDIWVGTNQNEIYVLEIKWLGKSITPSGNINAKYNTSERAIEGGYQLKDYLENPSQSVRGIHQAVLVLYDAREKMEDIVYPDELKKIPNLDLDQHFKIEKEKISASQSYKAQKK